MPTNPTRYDYLNVSPDPQIKEYLANCWLSDDFPAIVAAVQNFGFPCTKIEILSLREIAEGIGYRKVFSAGLEDYSSLSTIHPILEGKDNYVFFGGHDVRKYVYRTTTFDVYLYNKSSRYNFTGIYFKPVK